MVEFRCCGCVFRRISHGLSLVGERHGAGCLVLNQPLGLSIPQRLLDPTARSRVAGKKGYGYLLWTCPSDALEPRNGVEHLLLRLGYHRDCTSIVRSALNFTCVTTVPSADIGQLETKDVSVIGDFGTHSAKLLNYTGNFILFWSRTTEHQSQQLSISPVVKPQSQFVQHWGCFRRSSTKVSPKATSSQGIISAL